MSVRDFLLTREGLHSWLSRLARDYPLIAPVEEEKGVITFKQVGGPQEIVFDCAPSTLPPKEWFLPSTEELFAFSTAGGGITLQEPPGPKERVLFGLHPCDVRALLALDPVFGGTYPDPYYLGRRKATIIVALSCTKPGPYCFCPAVGGDPVVAAGADLLLTESGSSFAVKAMTSRGEEIIQRYPGHFAPDEEGRGERARQELAGQLAGMFAFLPDLRGVKEFLDGHFELPYWEEVASRCLGCGICTYTCPTCHCFDIFDQSWDGARGLRARCWDSCMFSQFTRMAGGHNPRPTQKERVRNRFLHKLKYHQDRYGLGGCVGCGRCVAKCPVNIDIRRIIGDLKELASHG
ncbi:4Fe-4S dicluster domain-containing protein [Desulfovirgula thermocuniculi]|uniref:4Fe-4S dicluster domain-containing protein n=1 Tax=Desulfovirgula thermocuniculi TaxID=348842 RepID=UPI000414B289|nr:4Fe-4S dicluster domain-containing protein [Desulfovirgula thermocuniculi]